MGDDNGVLALLARSEIRVAVLRQLAEEGVCERSTLESELPASGRTIKRTLNEFGNRDWVVRNTSGYALTGLGAHVLETYETAVESLAAGDDLKSFLKRIEGNVHDVPVSALARAEVVRADGSNPNAPLERALAFRRKADRLRELSSIVTRESAAQLRQRVREDDVQSVEIVLERDVVETIENTPEYSEGFEGIVESGRVDVFVYDGSVPCLLALGSEEAAMGVTDDNGFPTTLVVSESETVYEWAEGVYEHIRSDATPIAARQGLSSST